MRKPASFLYSSSSPTTFSVTLLSGFAMKLALIISISALGALSLMCCSSSGTKPATEAAAEAAADTVSVPYFSADSAYAHIAAQLAFGPRIPGTEAHARCAEYLTARLREYGADAQQWRKNFTDFKGNSFDIVNIVAHINPKAERRILLAAHWDSRRWADEDPDPAKHETPVDGANDGASGVAVILEMARTMSAHNPAVGIDILLTDAEDSGVSAPESVTDPMEILRYENSWCLGTQQWLASDPFAGRTRPEFGILLDMVGASGAVFPREYFSMRSASHVVDKIQRAARRAGTAERFPSRSGGAINDDHVHFNGYGIPTADVIDLRQDGFFPQWHTADDKLKHIDRTTLDAVGRTILDLIYHE